MRQKWGHAKTGAAADKKNLDTISSFTPVISSDADHDNQKLIKEEKSIEEKTATLDKTNGGSAAVAEVLVQSRDSNEWDAKVQDVSWFFLQIHPI